MVRIQDSRLCALVGIALLTLVTFNISRSPRPLTCENTNKGNILINTTRLLPVNSDSKRGNNVNKSPNSLIRKLDLQVKANHIAPLQHKRNHKSPDINFNKCPKDYTFSRNYFSTYDDKIVQTSSYSFSGKNSSRFNFNKTITILTPIYNGQIHLQHYFSLICRLSYPHELISIALGEDSSTDNSYEIALDTAKTLQPYFRKVSVFHFDNVYARPKPVRNKHDEKYQLPRRSHMARSRNRLLSKGVGNSDFVLWIDLDVKYYTYDIIQHLLSEDKDVLVPTCQWATGTKLTPYDWNNWQETPNSLYELSKLRESDLRVEGYGKDIKRHFLHNLNFQGPIVPLDGVGGCLLMVKAKCHQEGLVFPTFVFKHHIETEGLAKMAKTMGFGVYGLPSVTVIHTYS